MRGKFIVLYGVNNIGKSTQAKLLVEQIKALGKAAEYLKYPIYDLEPSGPLLNNYLRQGNPLNLTPRDAQMVYFINRLEYQPSLEEKLAAGINIIAEDYHGTGIGWGAAAGVEIDFLVNLGKDLLAPDCCISLDGERFTKAVEIGHKHETNNELSDRCRQILLTLARENNWVIVDANQTIEVVQAKLWQQLKHFFIN